MILCEVCFLSITIPSIGLRLWEDLSSPSYKRALRCEAKGGVVRHAQNSFPSLSTPSLDSLLELSPHAPFLSPRSHPLFHSIHLGPRAFFSTTNPSPIGPGRCGRSHFSGCWMGENSTYGPCAW